MIHTSLSRTAHVFAINWSETDYRRSLLPGRLPLVKRRLLLGVATVAIALVGGFAAGHSLPSASIAVPVSAPAAAAADPELPATITLSEPKLANLQLQIGQAKAGPLVRAVSATGSVGYDQLHLARIKPTARGRIETLDVTAGDRVVAGQRLAVLDNFDLSAAHSRVLGAEAALNQAKAQLGAANAAFDRAANLIRSDLVTQAELEARRATAATMEADLRTKEAELRQYQEEEARLLPVRPPPLAPTCPAISRRRCPRRYCRAICRGCRFGLCRKRGDRGSGDAHLHRVRPLNRLGSGRRGGAGSRHGQGGRRGRGESERVSGTRIYRPCHLHPRPDRAGDGDGQGTHEVPNPDGALRVNMFATVTILHRRKTTAVMVPSESLQEVNGQSVVFVPTADRRFAWRAVHTGLVANGKTQITSGLAAGTAGRWRGQLLA